MESHPDEAMGGAEVQAWQLAKELAKRGWKVSFVYESDGREHDLEKAVDGIDLYRLNIRKRSLQILNWFTLHKILSQVDPDVLYQRMAVPYTGMVAHFAKKNRRPFVWVAASEADCTRFRYLNWIVKNSKGGNLRKLINIGASVISDRMANYGIRNCTRAVVLSSDMERLLEKNFGMKSIIVKNAHAVPNENIVKANPPMVLWLGTLRKQKRPELFVELARMFAGKDYAFILAGRIDGDGYSKYFQSGTEQPANFQYLGEVDFETSNELLSKASVLVSTSTYEGFPNSFIQGWLRRTPVISLNADPDGIIEKYRLGFHSRTFDQLVLDTRVLLEDEELRKDKGDRARQYAVKEHGLSKMVDIFEGLFESLGSERHHG